jgi:hypothetical protein
LSPKSRAIAQAEGTILTKLNLIEDYIGGGLEVTEQMIDDLERAVLYKNNMFP